MSVRLSRRITKLSSMVAVAITSALSQVPVQADSLGVIQVESSTIGDRFEDKRLEPSAVSSISGKQVDRAHAENIQQMLQSIPGITSEVQSGDSLKIHIRGLENQVYMGEKPGVAVVIDGVPVFERTGRVNIDLDNIESIRVIKGGASYLFGDDALSGAVIITTKKGAGQAGYKVATEAGSFGHTKGLARVGFANDSANGHVQVSRRKTDGYYDDSGSQADYLNGKLQYYVDDSSDLQFGFELSDREKNSHGAVKGVTAAETDPTSEDPAYNDYANHYEVALQKLFLTYNRDLASGANLMVNTYNFSDDTAFLSKPDSADPEKYFYDNDYAQVQRGVKVEYRQGGEQLAWMVATDLRDNSYDNFVTYNEPYTLPYFPGTSYSVGDIYSNNETAEQVVAFYGEAKYRPADKWLLTLNGRTDRIDLDYTDHVDSADSGNKSFNIFSSRLGTNYAASAQVDYYASISSGFRAPSVDQLFIGSSNPTSRTAANPGLKSETTSNIELGMRRKSEMLGMPVEMDVALFQLDRKDHIQASGGQYSTSADSMYDNVGDMTSRGLELSLLGKPSSRWSWDLAYTYLDAFYTRYDEYNLQTCDSVSPFSGNCTSWSSTVYDNAGNKVPRTPDHHLNLSVNMMPVSGLTLTAEMDASSDYYADEINQEKIDGRQTYNLLVNYDRIMAGADWSFFARVDNLFDTFYYNTARAFYDANYDGVYDDEDLSLVVNQGRTFTAGISASF
jgi:iron complex outermembrane receptor protein